MAHNNKSVENLYMGGYMMGDFTKLVVWNKSMDLVVIIYELSANLPKQEMFALSDQMRRAAVSIPSNYCRGTV